MKTNLKRGTVVLLVIAGLTALNGSKAFRLHAESQVCTNAILLGGTERAPQASSTAPAIPMTLRFRPLYPSPRQSISYLMATANSQAPPPRITGARFSP